MSNTFYFQVIGWIITLLIPTTCLSASTESNTRRDFRTPSPNHIFSTEFVVVHPKPEPWESQSYDMYKNHGIAEIHRAAKGHMLTVSCEGIHQVFIQKNPKINLDEYVGKFIQARYTYGDIKKHVQCIKEPCAPITERKIYIHSIKETNGSEATRSQFENQCSP